MTKRIFYYLPAMMLIMYLLVGCSQDEDRPVEVNRVLLVYLGGDNNLSGESYDKFKAIEQGYKTMDNSRILVYQDALDAIPYLAEAGGKTIEEYGVEDSADPAVLKRVIVKAKSLYPQAKFNLLVFSHASGWLPDNSLVAPRSVIIDGNNQMELKDFADAIPDKAFEYIVFETCFMAGIEVVYQLRDKADYILASSAEIVSPGFTYVYTQHINELVYGSPKKFVQEAFNYFDNQRDYMRSATLSVIKTEELETLAGYIKNNCDLTTELNINDIQHFDRNAYWLFFDFGDYYSCLLKEDAHKEELKQLIDKVIIWKKATPHFMHDYNGFTIEKHSGLTTYIRQNRYPLMNEKYTYLDWYKAIE